jgi:FAD/FMN-containing dehydrogenase
VIRVTEVDASTTQHELLRRLSVVVGDANVVTGDADLRYFAVDALRGRGGIDVEAASRPLAVVRPTGGEETARVLALATAAGVPVVPYGAGTGLMGGARSERPGIVLDTIRLNTIEVRPEDRLVWAGAGCVLANVDAALREHGLCLGHDPWTFPVATVGGTLSTNSLGYRGGRYGGMGDQAIALEVALADGTLLRTRAVRRRSTGPDLARLFIGAEGVLGVITAAALEAHRIPERRELRAYEFATFEDGFEAIREIAALGLRPSLLDYGEEHASPWPSLSDREDEAPLLYVGFEGLIEEVEAALDRAKAAIKAAGGRKLGRKKAQQFWERRHVVAERFRRGQERPRRFGSNEAAFDFIHVALPPSQVLAFREACHAVSARVNVGLLECGLWTAPDFFSAAFMLPNAEGGHGRLNQVLDELLALAQDLSGSMEYVHGAGLRLAHLMAREHGDGLALLRRVKAALDPETVLNPGKLGL